ncbi:ribonuclease III [Spiroplasma turonicum]|uniref:Ribonuclease 3 n=1 Tax=Spiroplasma turonicum TaxID=216946 RepID=A0A0K1P6D6_9MOLU|nr:ribonuclease III [Spiroplasma turonicum]AKU79437.1 ribonuclease III [Spiroplasma turonicum]ALX70459.1 ribonuclease III [Spiroplasma turonicum]
MNNIKNFLNKFDIKLKDKSYYEEALTHNSFSNENRLSKNYQRLEFLGDAIIQQKVSEFLYKNFPKANEGILTKIRSSIVREESLAKVARTIKLGSIIRLGIGELDSKGYDKDSILADVFESFTAAIYLDLDSYLTDKWLKKTLFDNLAIESLIEETTDYKSELQELIQLEMRSDLIYKSISQEKDDKNQINFVVQVMIDNMLYGVGKGTSKKRAEQLAAKDALSKIKKTFK